ncbi:MAG: hypothetical protein ACRDQX_06905, partial [Pseudonocardiaceae bacterium]
MTTNVSPLLLAPTEERVLRRGRRLSRRRLYTRRFLRNRAAVAGALILALLVGFAIVGPMLTPYTYTDVDFTNLTSAPSSQHWFGTNGTGNDTFAQTAHGVRRSLVIGVVVS